MMDKIDTSSIVISAQNHFHFLDNQELRIEKVIKLKQLSDLKIRLFEKKPKTTFFNVFTVLDAP